MMSTAVKASWLAGSSAPTSGSRGVQEALQSPFVVQERVESPTKTIPAMVDGQLHIGRRLVDTDPFLFGSQVVGSLTRLSTVTLLNVTAGGGWTAQLYVIDKL